MKLYQSVGPNPRVVLFYLAEKGLKIDRAFVDIRAGENRQGEWLKKHPRGGIPVLELDDGSLISEATVICDYLDELINALVAEHQAEQLAALSEEAL